MKLTTPTALLRLRGRMLPVLLGPPALAFLPATTLGAFWIGGEGVLMAVALGVPLCFAICGAIRPGTGAPDPVDPASGMMLRTAFQKRIGAALQRSRKGPGNAPGCCLTLLELEDFRLLTARHGIDAGDQVMRRAGFRLHDVLRERDAVARLGDNRIGICLAASRRMDVEQAVQLAGRLQRRLEEPILIDGVTVHVTCTVGFCLSNDADGNSPSGWLRAAAEALQDARRSGASAIRGYSVDLQRARENRTTLRREVANALDRGEIEPWFQPQVSTDTGEITGFEALARWRHPEKGVLAPGVFLPAMEEAGLIEQLGMQMLLGALGALRKWDQAGLTIPSVGINLSPGDLRNPNLAEKIRWELDRFDLRPDRLTVEILETVVTDHPEEAVRDNIDTLARVGCRIDLDDFGTGHASIASIRRFAVGRLKIDRSFVMRADRDPEQQRMVAALLTMAERLGIETLAEGVETPGEHALMAQLGCDHVQGFGIAHPMPLSDTFEWMETHRATLGKPPRIGRGAT